MKQINTNIVCLLSRTLRWKMIPGTEAILWQGIAQHVLWTEKEMLAEDPVIGDLRRVIGDEISKRSPKT
jgi:quinate dehydrogenase